VTSVFKLEDYFHLSRIVEKKT